MKAFASTICDLNMNIFKTAVQSTDDVVFDWVIRDGRLLRLGEGEEPREDEITDDEAILQAIQANLLENVGAAMDEDDF